MEQFKELIEYIENGIPKHVRKKNEALFSALGTRHMGKMLFELETGANPQAKLNNVPITKMVVFDPSIDPAYLKLLLANGADANARITLGNEYHSFLYVTAMSILLTLDQGKSAQKRKLELLLDYGADQHEMDSYLTDSLFREVRELLLNRGATISAEDLNAILIDSMQQDLPKKNFKSLLRFRKRVAANDMQVLRASIFRNSQYLASLLDHGFDPNAKDENGNPIIFKTIEFGSVKHVALLLKAGAYVNSKNNKGSTPRDIAEWHDIDKKKEMMDLLNKHEAKFSQYLSPKVCLAMKLSAAIGIPVLITRAAVDNGWFNNPMSLTTLISVILAAPTLNVLLTSQIKSDY